MGAAAARSRPDARRSDRRGRGRPACPGACGGSRARPGAPRPGETVAAHAWRAPSSGSAPIDSWRPASHLVGGATLVRRPRFGSTPAGDRDRVLPGPTGEDDNLDMPDTQTVSIAELLRDPGIRADP